MLAGPASARTLKMETVSHNLTLNPDASVSVTENLTVNFSGEWHGFYVDIPQNYGTKLTEITVSENGQAYQFNPGTEYGPAGTFLVKETYDNVRH